MDDFFMAHEVKQHFLLLSECIGNSHFTVSIYNPNGMEVDFSTLSPKKCKTERCSRIVGNEIVGCVDGVEEESVKSMLRFNGFRRHLRYFKRSINQNDIYSVSHGLVSMKSFCQFFLNLFIFLQNRCSHMLTVSNRCLERNSEICT